MNQHSKAKPELEHHSLITLKPIPAVVECQCRKWRNVMYSYGRDHLMTVIERDLFHLLQDNQAKAYVVGFRSGQQKLLGGPTDGDD